MADQDEVTDRTNAFTAEKSRVANWILAGLIAGFGAVAFAVAVWQGRTDSALLFVALPTLLAAGLVLARSDTTHGRVFRITSVGLLLSAVAFHEGAICVLLAAPLVYAVAHTVTALVQWAKKQSKTYALLPVPFLLLSGLEGATDQLRINPDQSIKVVRVVALTPEEVRVRLAQGPHPTAVRSIPLRLLGMPTPQSVTGDGLTPGDRWLFAYPGSSHGPGGHIRTEIQRGDPNHLAFSFVEDTAITARWFTWQHAELSWRALGHEQTEITLAISYRRGLDPSWYFGPLQNGLLREGAGHLLDMLALR